MKRIKVAHSGLHAGLALVVCTLLLCSLPLAAQQISANWSNEAPFSQYKTYEWVSPKATNHPFYRQYVDEYVNYALIEKKGMRRVSATQNPDVYVTYHISTRNVMDVDTYGYGFGAGWGGWGYGGWGWGWGGPTYYQSQVRPRVMGYLTLDIIDAHTKKIVWRGMAIQDDMTKSGNAEEKQVANSVYKMLDRYPPKIKR